jgi:ABC-2 type transport system permease protein
MNSILLLLSPIWLSWRNEFLRPHKNNGRRLSLLALGLALWLAIYWIVRRVLIYFQSVYDLGPSLAYQLLLIIMLTFLSMLLFSNLITSLSTFFLARDLDLVLSSPVSRHGFYYSRLIMTAANSSWMVLFFGFPIFAAYGSVFNGGITLYLWLVLILPLFLLIPAALGVFFTHLVVYFLPARRIRDILFFIGLFAFILIFFLFRFSRPERLVQPESFGHFVQFINAMQAPSSPWLPSSWSGEILAGSLFARETEQEFFFAMLASYALFLPLAASWLSAGVYLAGWSKAQESRQGRRKSALLDRSLEWIVRPFPEISRALMLKDLKTFLRDATQWSQLFLLLALIIVYLYNFKVLPLDRSPIPALTLSMVVAFANLALAGFVLSAVAVRFAFPSVSLEGSAFWILQTSPISLRVLVWSKFWLNFLPLLLLGEILIFLSNLLLRVPAWMLSLSLITIFLMTFGIVAIGVGVGAIYPKFKFDNAAEIPTSFGGAVCMILSVAFIGVTVMIEAWPIYRLAMEGLRGRSTIPPLTVIVPSLAAIAALTFAVVTIAIRNATKRLAELAE